MLKKKVLVVLLSCLLLFLIVLLLGSDEKHRSMLTRMITLSDSKTTSSYVDNDLEVIELDVSKVENKDTSNVEETTKETDTDLNVASEESITEEMVSEEVVVPQPSIVYDGMTLDELASKLERSLKNELSGKGYLYASYSLEKSVDPYLAVAISLEETGCNWNCSRLVKSCNNVGGMKGTGCGSYGAFPTLDDGIRAFIDNIYRNYVAYGLTTAETMNPKYAENPAWASNVNAYITRIKNN